LIETIPWSILEGDRRSVTLYSASFGHSKNSKYILASGGGAYNEVKLFNASSMRAAGMANGFGHSVYSSALSPSDKMVAVAGGFKALYVYDIDHHQPAEFIY
jgi:hypothetical protein